MTGNITSYSSSTGTITGQCPRDGTSNSVQSEVPRGEKMPGGLTRREDALQPEVSRREKMLYSRTDPESYITEYTLVYEGPKLPSPPNTLIKKRCVYQKRAFFWITERSVPLLRIEASMPNTLERSEAGGVRHPGATRPL